MARRDRVAGFTLLELMLVLLVLGILAGVAVRHVEGSTAPVSATALSAQLGALRRAIEIYRLEHDGALPDGRIALQLTGPTDLSGNPLGRDGLPLPEDPLGPAKETVTRNTDAGASGQHEADAPVVLRPVSRGPYLRRIPTNAANGSDEIRAVLHLPLHPTGRGGWIYVISTGEIRADVPGRAPGGAAWWLM